MMMNSVPGDFILAPGEDLVHCPFNLAHQVTNLRLNGHLHKCRKEYERECKRRNKTPEMDHCKFNDKHIVHRPELGFHEERCEDRFKIVETVRYHQSAEFQRRLQEDQRRRQDEEEEIRKEAEKNKLPAKLVWGKAPPPPSANSAGVWGADAEDWEAESIGGYDAAYNPEARMKLDGSLYQPRGLSKSERKAYRAEQKVIASQRDPNTDLKEMKEAFAKFGVSEVNAKTEPKSEDKDLGNKDGDDYGDDYGVAGGLPTIMESKRETKEEKADKNKLNCKKEDEEEYEEYLGEDPFA